MIENGTSVTCIVPGRTQPGEEAIQSCVYRRMSDWPGRIRVCDHPEATEHLIYSEQSPLCPVGFVPLSAFEFPKKP